MKRTSPTILFFIISTFLFGFTIPGKTALRKNTLANPDSLSSSIKKGGTKSPNGISTPVSARSTQTSEPVVGVIRWDQWHVNFPTSITLDPSQYHDRIPFFGKENMPHTITSYSLNHNVSITIDGDQQSVMDQELAYAKDAGIGYFAFLWYGQSHYSYTRYKQSTSSDKQSVKFCYILEDPDSNDYPMIGTDMGHNDYQKVTVNNVSRPILYILTNYRQASALELLKNNIKTAYIIAHPGGAEPYFVVMENLPGAPNLHGASQTHANSSYISGGGAPLDHSFATLQSNEVAWWNNYKSYHDNSNPGARFVPWVTLGFDRRPRENGFLVPWQPSFQPDNWVETPTTAKITEQVGNAITFVKNNNDPGEVCEANTLIIYAWNEHDEGGWICPTIVPGTNQINRTHLDAVKAAINSSCPNPPSAPTSVGSSPSTINAGNSSTLSASCASGTPTWSDGPTGSSRSVSPSSTTTYSVTCVVSGCPASSSVSTTVTVDGCSALSDKLYMGKWTITNDSLKTRSFNGSYWLTQVVGQNPERFVVRGSYMLQRSDVNLVNGAYSSLIYCYSHVNTGIDGLALAPNFSTPSGYDYDSNTGIYSRQAGCTSPTPTSVTPSQTISSGSVSLSATCSSGTVTWSDGPTGSPRTVSPSSTTTYHVSCVASGCSTGSSVSTTVTVSTSGCEVLSDKLYMGKWTVTNDSLKARYFHGSYWLTQVVGQNPESFVVRGSVMLQRTDVTLTNASYYSLINCFSHVNSAYDGLALATNFTTPSGYSYDSNTGIYSKTSSGGCSGTQYLTNNWQSASSGYLNVLVGKNVGNYDMQMGSTNYTSSYPGTGLGTHAHSEIVYDLGASNSYTHFLSTVGKDNGALCEGNGLLKFLVYNNATGTLLGESPVLGNPNYGQTQTYNLSVNISGVRYLKLVMENGGDGGACDWGNWARARLGCSTSSSYAKNEPVVLQNNFPSNQFLKDEMMGQTLKLEVYPNPSDGNFKCTFNSDTEGEANLSISDMIGKPVFDKNYKVSKGYNTLDVKELSLSAGSYIIKLMNKGKLLTNKIVIE